MITIAATRVDRIESFDGGIRIDDRAKKAPRMRRRLVLGEETEFATWNLHHVSGGPGAGFGVRKGCATISDGADCLGGRYHRLDGIEDRNGSAQRLRRFPSSTSRSADNMVIRCRV